MLPFNQKIHVEPIGDTPVTTLPTFPTHVPNYGEGHTFYIEGEEYKVCTPPNDTNPLYRMAILTYRPHHIAREYLPLSFHIETIRKGTPTIDLPKYGGREGRGFFRPLTLEEAKTLKVGETYWAKAIKGDVRRVKINGKAKTWKRDKDRVEVPFKYGMYEFGRFDTSDILKGILLVEVEVR